jgi:hypothetical protein
VGRRDVPPSLGYNVREVGESNTGAVLTRALAVFVCASFRLALLLFKDDFLPFVSEEQVVCTHVVNVNVSALDINVFE